MKFDCLSLIYIIAVSLQVSGAVLLLVYNFSVKRENIIKTFANDKGYILRQGSDIDYDKDRLKEIFKIAYINKISFIYIIIGYILGVFGEIGENTYKSSIVLGIIVFGLILVLIGICIAKQKLISKEKKNPTFFDITNKDLDKLNVKDALELATNEDVNNMIDDIFHDQDKDKEGEKI